MNQADIKRLSDAISSGIDISPYGTDRFFKFAHTILRLMELDNNSVIVDTSKSKNLAKELIHRYKQWFSNLSPKDRSIAEKNFIKAIKVPKDWVYEEYNPNQMVWIEKGNPMRTKKANQELIEDLNKLADAFENMDKKAYGVYSIGDVVVCLNETHNLVKGQLYRVIDFTNEIYVRIEDLKGNEIGIFRADRFCKHNLEY